MLLSIGLLLIVSKDLNAATVYASNGTPVESDSNICANDIYYYQTDSNGMYEADIVSTDSRLLVGTSNSTNGEIEFSFPIDAGDLTVYVYDYNGSDRKLVDTIKFTISDCGYEVINDEYKKLTLKTTISKTDLGYQFTQPDLEDYNLYLNQLELDDDGVSKKVKFKDGIANAAITEDKIQLTESYINDKGNEVDQYFEIDLTNDIIIRKISSLDLTVIEPMQYIDRHLLVRMLIGMIVLIILYLINIVLVKQYKAKKAYKRKYKLYQQKRREAALKKRQEEELRKKRKQQMIKQKKLESERRANLEIRK